MGGPQVSEVQGFVTESLGRRGRVPEHLLQHLIAVQQRFGWVPPVAVESLAAELDVTRTQVRAAIAFYAFLHERPRGDFDILFSDNITDRMLGNRHLLARLAKQLGMGTHETRADGRVTLGLTSCTGMCDQGPALLVNGRAVTGLTAERIDRIAALVGECVPLERWPGDYFRVEDNVRRRGLLLSNADADGAGLRKLVDQGPAAALAEIERSGLRGRGGAGFTTALKWKFCREAPEGDRYVVCNADEGEPGTFKDRVLLTSYADLVLEGMTICAAVVGARRGFIYLRGEYAYLLPHLESVLARRRAEGLLGESILGQAGFDFEIAVHLGAGAYICGEESALIESLEGKRGVTRKRPPFPVVSGYRDRPTVVNNVETFLAAARVVRWGGYWFRGEGTDQSAGSKILSVSGDCARPGIYEYPFGTPVRRVLIDCGAERTQAVQVSGAAGTTLAPAEFDRLIAFEDLSTAGSFMVFDQSRDLLDMVQNFAAFFAHESCGFCTPCRVGGALLRNLVEKVAAGQASEHDLAELRQIGGVMRQTSYCGLGTTAPNHILNTLDKFPDIYRRRLRSADYTPSFDLDGALSEARAIAGRDDDAAHIPETLPTTAGAAV
ncbi:NAD(P)H-dependent oxidoreductase subunit E [uncultured Thiodictyon sp.]|uniref:NAD(P)H-dependent oxidoreductase subunit E n=1 Tax=uncultured Thiodictyon sp. TaxID=1846217 RepID=UPI0025F11C81|nr:NAD(P)H-dependent oxidoreductase subunit E [uncultured Thiodictyon sp.]